MNSHLLKTLAACSVAPLLVGILAALFVAPMEKPPLVLEIAIFMVIPATLLIGVLAHTTLLAKSRTSWQTYVFAGSLGGIGCASLVFLIWMILPLGYYDVDGELWIREEPVKIFGMAVFAGIGIVAGAIHAFFFWCIRRPDLDQARMPSQHSAVDC